MDIQYFILPRMMYAGLKCETVPVATSIRHACQLQHTNA